MDDIRDEIASDLEWILQSGQANDDMLLETLVYEYAEKSYRLALAVLADPILAREQTVRICVLAARKTQRYRSQDGVDFWLISLAIQELRKSARLQSLSWSEKTTFFLKFIYGWDEAQIARALKTSSASITTILENGAEKLIPESLETKQAETLTAVLESRWPPKKFSDLENEEILLQSRQAVQKNKNKFRISLRLRESAIAALVILFIAGLTWGYDLIFPDERTPETALAMQAGAMQDANRVPSEPFIYTVHSGDTLSDIAQHLDLSIQDVLSLNGINENTQLSPGQQLLIIPGRARQTKTFSPTATPTPMNSGLLTRFAQTRALDRHATLAEVIEKWRISELLWDQLYLTVQWIDYGPSSYLGPIRIERFQVWVEQPGSSLLRKGDLNAVPDQTHLIVDGKHYLQTSGEKATITWWDEQTDPLIPDERLELVINPLKLLEKISPDSLVIKGDDRIEKRKALILEGENFDGSRFYRLWIDRKTGLLLRLQEFAIGEQLLLNDLVVTQMLVDPDFSSITVFDYNKLNPPVFASDFSQPFTPPQDITTRLEPAVELAVRLVYPASHAPEGFNPASSQLQFVFAESVENNQPQTWSAQILADGYGLGETSLGAHWQIRCQRSADGMFLAFSIDSKQPTADEQGIHWMSLSQPENVFQALTDYQITGFAFAPDGRNLAVIGRDVLTGANTLYLLDFATGEYQKAADLDTAHSLPQPGLGADVGTAARLSSVLPTADYPAWLWEIHLTPIPDGLDACALRKP